MRSDLHRKRGEGTGWGRDAVALLVIALLFAWLGLRYLDHPGPYEDELWSAAQAARFVLGAPITDPVLGRPVVIFGHAAPFMLNAYVGPVKTYLLMPLFALFGVNVMVMRLTTSLVALVATWLVYLLMRREFDRVAALTSGVLLATDLNWVLMTRNDWGPVALGGLARVVAVYALLGWRRQPNRRGLLSLACLTLGLGLAHKFDFLSFVVACAISFALVYGRDLRVGARELAVAGGSFVVGAWPVLWLNLVTGGVTLRESESIARGVGQVAFPHSLADLGPYLAGLPTVAQARVATLRVLLDGTSTANWMLGEAVERRSSLGASPLPFLVVGALVLLVAWGWRVLPVDWRRPAAFLLALFAFSFLFITLTPFAVGAHHMAGVYPLPHLLVGVALGALWRVGRRSAWSTWVARGAAVALFAIVVVANLVLGQAFYGRLLTRGGAGAWSEAIYDLYTVLQREHAGETVELMDWGFEKGLAMLGQEKLTLSTPYWRVLGDEQAEAWLADLMRMPGRVFVVHADRYAAFPQVGQRLMAAYERQGNLAVDEQKFYQANGEHVFSVLRFHPRAASNADASVRRPAPALTLLRLYPDHVAAGEGFNVQPDGSSAFAAGGANISPETVLVFNDRPLPTTYGGPTGVTALAPPDLPPGRYPVYLRDPRESSNTLEFIVEP